MDEMPDEIVQILGSKKAEDMAMEVVYRNYKGEVKDRKIIPLKIYYGHNEYHTGDQWLLKVWDLDKRDYREYAFRDILEWKKV
ncbi:MAG: hypothetical protein Q8Q31_01130 [Nanoarchaeota archaeon]|nr:hypothetical protein [Nanoarchaeota archaeon]